MFRRSPLHMELFQQPASGTPSGDLSSQSNMVGLLERLPESYT